MTNASSSILTSNTSSPLGDSLNIANANSTLLSGNSSAPGVRTRFTNTVIVSAGMVVCMWVIVTHATIVSCYAVNRAKTWTTYSKQILSLSLNDLSVGVTYLIMLIEISMPDDMVPYDVCSVSYYFYFSALCANLYHVFVICIHRAMMLFRDSTTVAPTGTRINALLFLIGWIPAFVLCGIAFALWAEDRKELRVCVVTRIFGDQQESALAFISASYIIPMIFTNIVYGVTFYKLAARLRRTFPIQTVSTNTTTSTYQAPGQAPGHTSGHAPGQAPAITKSNANRAGQAPTTTSSNANRPGMLAQRRATVTIGLLLLFFNLFSVPFIITMVVMVSGIEVNRNIRVTISNMFALNSVTSPFVYALRVKNLGETLKKCLPCYSRR